MTMWQFKKTYVKTACCFKRWFKAKSVQQPVKKVGDRLKALTHQTHIKEHVETMPQRLKPGPSSMYIMHLCDVK